MTARFQAAAATWRDVLGWHDERLAAQIRDDRIDVLFDLAGHTAHNRMLTFARKPAAVQITWIGYEGTTGLSAIDYLLADRYMVPEQAEPFYREKVLRLPDCYLCFDPPEESPPVGPLPAHASGLRDLRELQQPGEDQRRGRRRLGRDPPPRRGGQTAA